jgi:hypothetical protein
LKVLRKERNKGNSDSYPAIPMLKRSKLIETYTPHDGGSLT